MLDDRQAMQKVRVIARDASHISAKHDQLLLSGHRFRLAKVSMSRAAKSFVTQAVYVQLVTSTTKTWCNVQCMQLAPD